MQRIEREQILNALCINYTAAYCCDLMTNDIEVIKETKDSHYHSARENRILKDAHTYSEWINYAYEKIIIKETAPNYMEVFERKNLMKRLRKEESFSYRHRTIKNDAGMEYFETVVVKLYEDEKCFKVILGYQPMDDIMHEEMQHQKQLEEALRAAEIANQSKTEFLSRMSHDIRTPLNGIIGLLNIDENHLDDAALVRANHEKMRVAANHLLSLINDVLQMSKLEENAVTFAHEPIDLVELTRDIVVIVVDEAIEAGIKWKFERGKSVIPYRYIYGSSLHLRQIFLNIYGNCIKYNRRGGTITTVVEDCGSENGICTYRWIISDTGIGMTPDFVSHIFEPFAQEKDDARSNYQGTGLGMAIVKQIIDRMGGSISVTSELGKGSTFIITIPFEIAPVPATISGQSQKLDIDITGYKLMLVEDNDLNAEIAKTILEDNGAQVTVVENGKLAVDLFADCKAGTFDAILMDIMMPVMNGLEATKAIRKLNRADAKTIPIIAMTANAFEEDVKTCLEAGMNAHLAKPLDIEKMKRTIYEQINKIRNTNGLKI